MNPTAIVHKLLETDEDEDDFDVEADFKDYLALPTKGDKISYIHIGSERSHDSLFTINGIYTVGIPYYNILIYVNGKLIHVTPLMRGSSSRYVRIGTSWLENNGYIPDGIPFWDYVTSKKIPVTEYQSVVWYIEDFSPPFDGE